MQVVKKKVWHNLKRYKLQTVKYKVALCNTDETWLPTSSHKVLCGQVSNLDQVCNDVILRVFYGRTSKNRVFQSKSVSPDLFLLLCFFGF